MKNIRYCRALVLALFLAAVSGLAFAPGRAAVAAEKAKGESSSSKGEKDGAKPGGDITYLHMQPLVLPVIGPRGTEQIVTLLVDLQVKDITVSDKIRAVLPRLQDAIVQSLYGGFGDGSLRDGDRVNIEKVKVRIAETLDKALDSHMVDDVLIQGMAQRMF